MTPHPIQALRGVRILSLALNLPGPAALMRCRQMGATCTKLEPPGPTTAQGGDPMQAYNAQAYHSLHTGVRVLQANLKSDAGQHTLHQLLAETDVLLTSFRPSVLPKLGLGWEHLHARYPALSQIAIVGAPGARAEVPGHDLTYMAENGLVPGCELPATLYADMAGSLTASEAVLQAVLHQRLEGSGVYLSIALSDAAAYLGLPRTWGMTLPDAAVGGAHAGYRVYPCKDGRVALAALEPHFAARLCAAAQIDMNGQDTLLQPATHAAIARFVGMQTCAELEALARTQDIPMHTLPR